MITFRKLGCANPVGMCELSPEVCLIVIGFEQTASGLLETESKTKETKASNTFKGNLLLPSNHPV